MLRKTLFFSSLMGDGSRAVGGSIAVNARIWNRLSHHHVAKRPGRLVESGAFTGGQGLRYVDLHVIDEVAVPDRLKQPVGKTEGEDVLRRLLAKEVVDPEDPVLVKYLMQPGVQRYRTRQVGAERLFHDDPGPVDETGIAKHPHRRQGRARRHAHVMQATAFGCERLLRPVHCRFEDLGTSGERHVVQILDEGIPVDLVHLARGELIECPASDLAEAVSVELIERDADDPAAGNKPGSGQMEQPR